MSPGIWPALTPFLLCFYPLSSISIKPHPVFCVYPLFANLAGPQGQWQWGPFHQVCNMTEHHVGMTLLILLFLGISPKIFKSSPTVYQEKKGKVIPFNTISISFSLLLVLARASYHPPCSPLTSVPTQQPRTQFLFRLPPLVQFPCHMTSPSLTTSWPPAVVTRLTHHTALLTVSSLGPRPGHSRC